MTSLRVGWIPVAAAFSGSARTAQGSLLWVESDQTKYCTEVLKRPISLKFYRNFTSVSRQRNHHQQKSGYEQLQRPATQTNCVSSTSTNRSRPEGWGKALQNKDLAAYHSGSTSTSMDPRGGTKKPYSLKMQFAKNTGTTYDEKSDEGVPSRRSISALGNRGITTRTSAVVPAFSQTRLKKLT